MTTQISDVTFAFGPTPGSYVLDTVQHFKHWGIPTVLIQQLSKAPGLRKLHVLAIGEIADIVVAWMTKDGASQVWVSPQFTSKYTGLAPAIDKWNKQYGNQAWSIAFSHNADGATCFEAGAVHHYGWDDESKKAFAEYKGVRHVTLGVGTAVFFLHDGGYWYSLKNNYPTLYKVLTDFKPSRVTYVALNPYRADEFILVNNNDTAWFKLHHTFAREVETILRSEAICCYNYTPNRPCGCGSSSGDCTRPDKHVCPPAKDAPCNDCPAQKPGCGCNGTVHGMASFDVVTSLRQGRSVSSDGTMDKLPVDDEAMFEVV